MTHKRYLATTAISELWDLDSDLLLLGPWCLTEENKKLLEGKNYTMVESPWRPFGPKIKEAADYCHKVYEETLPILGEALNNLHSVSYPERYWRVLLGPWLLHFIGVLYERYVRLQHASELYPNLYTHCLDGDYEISSNDTEDFCNNKVYGDEHNFRLFSLVCTCLGVKTQKISKLPAKGISYIPQNRGLLLHIRGFVKRLAKKSLAFLPDNPVVLADMYHLRLADYWWLSLKTGYRLLSDEKFYREKAKFDYSQGVRTKLVMDCPGSDSFTKFLCQLLPYAVPRCYVEGFHFYRESSPSLDGAKVIGSAVGWYFNEIFKFLAAEAVSNGVHLVDFQQGGGMGNFLVVPSEDLSLEKEVFYTWGWDSRARHAEKLLKLPSPHLSRLKNSYSYSINNLLYIGTEAPRYHFRFFCFFLPEEFLSYLENTKRFFQSLPEGLRSHILYRPYPHDYGWDIRRMIKEGYPQVELLTDTGVTSRLTDWMRRVKICVIDIPSTSFIEALTINVPCIFFWNHEVFVMRPEAEEYFELLRRAGILYKTPEEAAAKLTEVFDDPWTWWKSREVQEARNVFLERFGYSRKDWMEYWAEEIRLLASEKRFTSERK